MDKLFIKEIYLPILYIAIGFLLYRIAKRVIKKVFSLERRTITNKKVDKKKLKTLEQLVINILRFITIIFIILSILTVFGVNVKTFLAGLGVISVVIGLALQDILKDFIMGFSLIIENYFSVGDTVEISGFKGKVIHLGLRTTKLQQFEGPVLIVPNRNIAEVINYTNSYSQAIVDVDVAYESDFDKVERVLQETAISLTKTLKGIVNEVEVLGVEKLDSSSVTYRIMVNTEPLEQFIVQRKIRKEILTALNKANIKIPYPQIEVHNGK